MEAGAVLEAGVGVPVIGEKSLALEGAGSCSQGREALDKSGIREEAPKGRHLFAAPWLAMSPLRGFLLLSFRYQGLSALATRLRPSGAGSLVHPLC